MITHGIYCLMMFVNRFLQNQPWLQNSLLAVIQTITMIYAFQYIVELPTNSLWESDVLEFNQFNFWIMAEFGICMFGLVTSVLYLFFRLFNEQKICIYSTRHFETDFLMCQHLVINLISFCAPGFLITCMVLYLLDGNSSQYQLWKTQMYFGWFQVIAIFYLLFVSCLKAPTWWRHYVLYSRYIHGSL